ncbi:hypothetical protein Godav_011553 [Gossypium davidsonii]|uniref:HTH CENPB-type domain-containing protein n=1 Tax=Gossypium davidsonii TaxID=34287 RepID=A0A7J8RAB4_GOSDV|nr:hypothetical protein [Gossypium davidsonii]
MYGDANSEFNFSIGWLERLKTRHGIKSYRRFGESGSIIMENIEYALPQIRAKLKIFYWKDIYNMDETGLFYCLQLDARMTSRKVLLIVDNCASYPKQLRFIINAAFILTSWNVTRKEK